MTILMVAFGGALGAVLRYSAVAGAARAFGAGFPVGTLVVNVLGSFAMGVVAALVMGRSGAPPVWLPAITTGFLGGFTTFSAFSLDAYLLFESGRFGPALVYIAASLILSLMGLLLGIVLVRGVGG